MEEKEQIKESPELEKEYWTLIHSYKKQLLEIRKAERKGEDTKYILFLDKERDKTHQQLRKLAPLIGKNNQDVDFDILESEGNLSEYQLPEFNVLRTFEITSTSKSKQGFIQIYRDGFFGEPISSRRYQEDYSLKERSLNLEIFIPFGEKTSWHLFDYGSFFERPPDFLEKERRCLQVYQELPEITSFIQINLTDTFHNGVEIFGIAVSKNNFYQLINHLRQRRKDLSIKKEYLDSEQIKKDFRDILKEDIDEIFEYGWDEYGDPRYHFRRYRENVKIPIEYKEIAKEIFNQKEEELKDIEIKREIALNNERIDKLSKQDIDLPKFESTRRRKK
jgi:hypothetical protein